MVAIDVASQRCTAKRVSASGSVRLRSRTVCPSDVRGAYTRSRSDKAPVAIDQVDQASMVNVDVVAADALGSRPHVRHPPGGLLHRQGIRRPVIAHHKRPFDHHSPEKIGRIGVSGCG
jgi:hypothetical protein